MDEFWQYDVVAPKPCVPIQVFPSGCVVLRFDISAIDVKAVIYGPSLRPDLKSVFVAGVSAFGVSLRLERAPSVVGCEISELRDQRIELEMLWPGETQELCDRLWRALGFDERAMILASFLRRRIRERKAPHADFLRAMEHLSRGGNRYALPRDLALSRRTLRRHFDANVGVSPKQLGRTIRVQATMRELVRNPAAHHSRVSMEAGFSDQPHFNREFKRILGMSPGAFARYVGHFDEPALPIWTGLLRPRDDLTAQKSESAPGSRRVGHNLPAY